MGFKWNQIRIERQLALTLSHLSQLPQLVETLNLSLFQNLTSKMANLSNLFVEEREILEALRKNKGESSASKTQSPVKIHCCCLTKGGRT